MQAKVNLHRKTKDSLVTDFCEIKQAVRKAVYKIYFKPRFFLSISDNTRYFQSLKGRIDSQLVTFVPIELTAYALRFPRSLGCGSSSSFMAVLSISVHFVLPRIKGHTRAVLFALEVEYMVDQFVYIENKPRRKEVEFCRKFQADMLELILTYIPFYNKKLKIVLN